VSTLELWTMLLGMGLVTFALRYSFIALFGRFRVPGWLEHALVFVPAAVLAALVVPAVALPGGESSLTNPRLWAGVLAALIAYMTKSVLWTIAGGMLALWVLQALFTTA
jgi:branched-subunit amino acid transport protein